MDERDRVIYISGPMEGYYRDNFDTFSEMENILSNHMGYTVVNPAVVKVDPHFKCTHKDTRQDYYRKDIRALTYCHEIVMLKGWQLSHGAQLERYVALEMGLRIRYEEELEMNEYAEYVFREL